MEVGPPLPFSQEKLIRHAEVMGQKEGVSGNHPSVTRRIIFDRSGPERGLNQAAFIDPSGQRGPRRQVRHELSPDFHSKDLVAGTSEKLKNGAAGVFSPKTRRDPTRLFWRDKVPRGQKGPETGLRPGRAITYNADMAKYPEGLEKAILDYRPVVSFRVRRSLGSVTPDWEDVVNEIMTQVLEKVRRQEFRGESSIGTFIYIITSRRIVDYIRNKTKVLRHVPDPGRIPEPDEPLQEKERADMLARLIKQLKPKYRDVLKLYYYQEMSRVEVARKLGISPSKVSERIHYAQKLLRKKLGP